MELEGSQTRCFFCDCSNEMIRIDRDTSCGVTKVWFGIYMCGIVNHEYSLKERLRHCWQIIKNKSPYADFAILNVEEARRMGETLLKITENEK